MGLDFSHCNANWAYGGFARFRKRLADQIGFPQYETVERTDDERFDAFKKDPITYLLAHSDCDGHLTAKQCEKLAPRLAELINDWPDDFDKSKAKELINGMKLAAKKKQKLKFR